MSPLTDHCTPRVEIVDTVDIGSKDEFSPNLAKFGWVRKMYGNRGQVRGKKGNGGRSKGNQPGASRDEAGSSGMVASGDTNDAPKSSTMITVDAQLLLNIHAMLSGIVQVVGRMDGRIGFIERKIDALADGQGTVDPDWSGVTIADATSQLLERTRYLERLTDQLAVKAGVDVAAIPDEDTEDVDEEGSEEYEEEGSEEESEEEPVRTKKPKKPSHGQA